MARSTLRGARRSGLEEPWAQYINRSAPCLPAHQCVLVGTAGVFRALLFVSLPYGCLYDDDCPVANLEPRVSGKNSLPLPALRAQGQIGLIAFKGFVFASFFMMILNMVSWLIFHRFWPPFWLKMTSFYMVFTSLFHSRRYAPHIGRTVKAIRLPDVSI